MANIVLHRRQSQSLILRLDNNTISNRFSCAKIWYVSMSVGPVRSYLNISDDNNWKTFISSSSKNWVARQLNDFRSPFSQHDVPPGKHALITVKQPKGNLLWIQTPKNVPGANKRKNTENEKFVPHLTTWDECDIIQVCGKRILD